jgi:hypothetical protein
VNETTPVDPRMLRVSDAERSHVVDLLQKAIGQGLINLDEFTSRTDTALAAKTRAELNGVLVDLPGLVHREASSPRHARPVELRATLSAVKRTGRWVVPPALIVRNKMGSATLDFTEAEIAHPEIRVELDVSGGAVEMLVPEGAMVTTDDLDVTLGSVKSKSGPTTARPGRTHFIVHGTLQAGTLKIRRPTYIRLGAMVIRFPWKITWDRD